MIAAPFLGLSVSFTAQAQSPSPMRELIVQSETVVLAAPADPHGRVDSGVPKRFKAIRVLLGTALKEGDQFEIVATAYEEYHLTLPAVEGAPAKPAKPSEVLLFLKRPKKDAAPIPCFPLTPSGMRMKTVDGSVYYTSRDPSHETCSLKQYRNGISWDDLLRKAASDAAEVRHVRSLTAIQNPRRRNAALLDWIERHRQEFAAGLYLYDDEEPSYGWGSLEQGVFAGIWQSRIPQDCWAAVKLYAELNQGYIPG